METREQKEYLTARIHYLASCIAGFLGLFPMVNLAGLFGSAQTSNLIETVLAALAGNGRGFLLHGTGVLLYMGAIVLATVISRQQKINMKFATMLVDTITAFILWRYPVDLPVIAYLYPTFFAMAFHWCAFGGAYGFVSATIFSTNNFRMFISALIERIFYRNKAYGLKAKFFGLTLLSFHTGIVTSWFCWRFLGNAGFLFVIIPIALCTIQISKEVKGEIKK